MVCIPPGKTWSKAGAHARTHAQTGWTHLRQQCLYFHVCCFDSRKPNLPTRVFVGIIGRVSMSPYMSYICIHEICHFGFTPVYKVALECCCRLNFIIFNEISTTRYASQLSTQWEAFPHNGRMCLIGSIVVKITPLFPPRLVLSLHRATSAPCSLHSGSTTSLQSTANWTPSSAARSRGTTREQHALYGTQCFEGVLHAALISRIVHTPLGPYCQWSVELECQLIGGTSLA